MRRSRAGIRRAVAIAAVAAGVWSLAPGAPRADDADAPPLSATSATPAGASARREPAPARRTCGPEAACAPGPIAAAAPCSEPDHPGGEWPGLNGDLSNTRSQPLEHDLGPDRARRLRPRWTFSGAELGIANGMRSTPVVSGGCIFLGFGQGYLGDRGDIVALDADTGDVVWHTRIDGSVLGLAVHDGLVYATPSRGTRGDVVLPVVTDSYQPAGSTAIALDASTGAVRWRSERLDDGNAANGTFVNASPVVFDPGSGPLVFVPLSGGGGDGARVPMWFLDARTGATVAKSYSLTDAEYAAGFGGTGIWSTAAYDPTTRHLYAGTADSDGRTRQHPYNNALLRIDADPTRPTFAKVVASYRGTSEHADLDPLIGAQNNPLCGLLGDTGLELPTFFDTSASPECLELDFDFGGSPNLVPGPDGRLLVTALQKSGVLHAVDASTMTARWRALVGPGGPAMDGATAAVAGGALYVGATPNLVFGFDRATGRPRWRSTTGVDVFAYQPLTVADGVLYGINDVGQLVVLNAADGSTLAVRDLAGDAGFAGCLGVGAGVAVAHHLVLAPCDGGGLSDLAGLPGTSGGLVAYTPG